MFYNLKEQEIKWVKLEKKTVKFVPIFQVGKIIVTEKNLKFGLDLKEVLVLDISEPKRRVMVADIAHKYK